jgi:hypothetical protein
MRSATAIVGAIAVSSILIALAFLLSGSDDSGQAQVTMTVTERVEAAELKPEVEKPATQETGVAHVGGPTQCSGGKINVENVSCEVGTEIHSQYVEGARGELIAMDKEASETIIMTCGEPAPVICTGPGGAKVYFEP